MKIKIFEEYDGFEIMINNKSFRFSQEGSIESLIDVFKEACPDADISYEEVY